MLNQMALFYWRKGVYYSSLGSYGEYKILNSNIIKLKESTSSNSNTTTIKPLPINKFKLHKSSRERGFNCLIFILRKMSL